MVPQASLPEEKRFTPQTLFYPEQQTSRKYPRLSFSRIPDDFETTEFTNNHKIHVPICDPFDRHQPASSARYTVETLGHPVPDEAPA